MLPLAPEAGHHPLVRSSRALAALGSGTCSRHGGVGEWLTGR